MGLILFLTGLVTPFVSDDKIGADVHGGVYRGEACGVANTGSV